MPTYIRQPLASRCLLTLRYSLKQEHGVLRVSLQDSRAYNAAQQRRNVEWQHSWKKEVDLVSKREKKLLHDENAWDAKLADKRRELDDLEGQLIKKKDEARIKHDFNVQGDNNNQSIKIAHLEKEVDKWRKQFFEAQKENEKTQQIESKYLREAEMTKALREEITSLQQLYAERVERDNSSQQTKYQERARELMLKVEEMDLGVEKLREEAKLMQILRDDAIGRCDELKAKHHVEHGVSSLVYSLIVALFLFIKLSNVQNIILCQKTLRDCAKYEAMSETLQERALVAEREARESAAVTKGFEESLGSARKDVARLKDTIVAKKAEHDEVVKQLRQAKMQCDRELRAHLSQAQELFADEQAKTTKAELRYKEAHESRFQNIKQITNEFEGNSDDTKKQLLVAQDRIRRIENKLSNLEGEKVQLLHNHQAEMQRLKHACESCHKDLNLVLLQKEEAETMCEAMSSEASQQTKQLEEYERATMKADEQCKLSESEELMMRRKVDELELDNKALEQRMQIFSDRIIEATKEADVWKEKSSMAQKKAGEVSIRLFVLGVTIRCE